MRGLLGNRFWTFEVTKPAWKVMVRSTKLHKVLNKSLNFCVEKFRSFASQCFQVHPNLWTFSLNIPKFPSSSYMDKAVWAWCTNSVFIFFHVAVNIIIVLVTIVFVVVIIAVWSLWPPRPAVFSVTQDGITSVVHESRVDIIKVPTDR